MTMQYHLINNDEDNENHWTNICHDYNEIKDYGASVKAAISVNNPSLLFTFGGEYYPYHIDIFDLSKLSYIGQFETVLKKYCEEEWVHHGVVAIRTVSESTHNGSDLRHIHSFIVFVGSMCVNVRYNDMSNEFKCRRMSGHPKKVMAFGFVCIYDSYVLTFGGHSGKDGRNSNEIWCLDIESVTWSVSGSVYLRRRMFNCCAVWNESMDCIFVIGGCCKNESESGSGMRELDCNIGIDCKQLMESMEIISCVLGVSGRCVFVQCFVAIVARWQYCDEILENWRRKGGVLEWNRECGDSVKRFILR